MNINRPENTILELKERAEYRIDDRLSYVDAKFIVDYIDYLESALNKVASSQRIISESDIGKSKPKRGFKVDDTTIEFRHPKKRANGVCPDCGNLGWKQDNKQGALVNCPCHY